MSKANRNDPCPCGSGVKYKKCCGKNDTRRSSTKKIVSAFPGMKTQPLSPSSILAKKAFKVLSAPVQSVEPVESKERGYGSLEELIGIEGAPSS